MEVVKTRELREKTNEELEHLLHEATENLFNFRLQATMGTLEKLSSIRNSRKDIAKIKTLLHEKELGIQRTSKQEQT